MEAPYSALVGVIVDARQPTRLPVTARCRVRHQVGYTNRWRLPESLGSDLLGTSQALKAIQQSYSRSVIQIITAENPKIAINRDESKPYAFKGNPKIATAFSLDSKSRPTSNASRVTVMSLRRPPSTVNAGKPMEMFLHHARRSGTTSAPDVQLNFMDFVWEVHRLFIEKSATLKKLLEEKDSPVLTKYFKTKTQVAPEQYKEPSNHSNKELEDQPTKEPNASRSEVAEPKQVTLSKLSSKTTLDFSTEDPLITPHAFAIALGHLYHEDLEVEPKNVVSVLAAAVTLKFHRLEQGCVDIMHNNIDCLNVGRFYVTAVKYHKEKIITACVRWLELNLTSQMSCHISLREIPHELLLRTLESNRLFIFSEFALFKVLAYWVFLQINAHIQVMPTYSTVVTFFNGLPKGHSLLETDEGEHFMPLFASVRLHGITESNQIHDVQMMNILPRAWVLKALTQHYHSLQTGGDMSVVTNYVEGAVRHGFIIDGEPQYHSEIFSLHGFHFELKVVQHANSPGKFSFSVQRLQPGDPVLSYRHNERSTFSMRPEREVKYSMKIQYHKGNQIKTYSTGQLRHVFGLGVKTSKGQVLTIENLNLPINVSFAFYFPPS